MNKPSTTTKLRTESQALASICENRQNDGRHKVFELEEIFALETTSDAIFTLKVLYFALEMASEFAATEYGDLNLRSDVLALCEEKIRHG